MAVSLQQTLLVPLIPALPGIFDTSVDTASWLITISLLAGAVATPILTKLADMYGKRRMVLIVLALMVVGSVLMAVTTNLVLGLVGRVLQGVAAAVVPVGISILRDELPKERIGFGIALMSATLGIGGALGLPLSGLLYETLGWSAVFWVSAVVTATIFTLILVIVRESPVRSPGTFDWSGALVLSVALTALMLVISKGSSWGWTSATLGLLVAVTVVAFAVWVPMQLRRSEPMVDLRTTVSRPVLLTNVSSMLLTVGMMANGLLTVPFVEADPASGHGFGLTVMQAGLVMAPSGLVMVLFAPVSGWMLQRIGGRVTLITGAGLVALSYLLRPSLSDNLTALVIVSTLCGLGAAIAFAAMPALIMSSVPITETASANGINSLMRAVGMAAASAGTAALFASMTEVVDLDGVATTIVSGQAYTLGSLICAAFAAFGTGVAFFIPVRRGVGAVPEAGSGSERVIRGRLLLGSFEAPSPVQVMGTVVLTRPDGSQVDWARPDFDGHFSLALPRRGRYLVIATARGWAPRVTVADLADDDEPITINLPYQLTVHGTVTHHGVPVSDATVTMFRGTGEHAGHTLTDSAGRWSLPLPPSGTYLAAAALPETGDAVAEKFEVQAESVQVHLPLVAPDE